MSNSYELTLVSSSMLDIKLLLDYLQDFPDISIYNSNEKSDVENLLNITEDVFLEIKKVTKEKYLKVLGEMKVTCEFPDILKSILSVLEKNKNLLIIAEIISHGITYFDAMEKINFIINEIKQVLEINPNPKFNIKTNEITQVILGDFKLEYLIFLIMNNYHKPLVFTAIHKGRRNIISCFVLLSLLHEENPSLTNQLVFLSLENGNIGAKSIISSDEYIVLSDQENLIESCNRNSCYFIMDDCDLHSSAMNYLNALGTWFVRSDRPNLCLVQESIYGKFIALLKIYLEKSKEPDLFDRNRQLSLVYATNIDFILEFMKTDSNVNLLTPIKVQNGKYFHLPFIFDKVQPQNEFFSRKYNSSELCSFILTFRNCEEGLMLANKLYREKSSFYLWTENISQCFEMKSKLDYEKIYVNTVNIPKFQFQPIKINYNASLISKRNSNKSILLANKISNSLELLKGKMENKNFEHRFKKINKVIDKLKSDNLIDEKLSEHIRRYLEIQIDRFKASYKVEGNIHTIIEKVPIGNIVLYLGDIDVNGCVIQLILASWLFGNNVLVISSNDFHNLLHTLVEMNNMKSLSFLEGTTSISELNKCFIDSVVALSYLETDKSKQELENLKFSLYHKVVEPDINNIDGLLDYAMNFIQKDKLMLILSGGINTK